MIHRLIEYLAMKSNFVWGIICICLFYSCVPNKQLVYLQDTQNGVTQNELTEYKIKAKDVLHVKVLSLDSQISSFFNVESSNGFVPNNPSNQYLNGYIVSDTGNIIIPIIGKVFVKGMTIEEVRQVVQEQVDKHVINATVIVKHVNFKISVVGEVSRPGFFYIYNDRINIFEALSMAGDITAFGKRKEVRVVRNNSDGTEIITVDLTKQDVLTSPAYYLQPDDVVYVENLKAKAIRNNINPLTVVFAGISALVLLLNFGINLNR